MPTLLASLFHNLLPPPRPLSPFSPCPRVSASPCPRVSVSPCPLSPLPSTTFLCLLFFLLLLFALLLLLLAQGLHLFCALSPLFQERDQVSRFLLVQIVEQPFGHE